MLSAILRFTATLHSRTDNLPTALPIQHATDWQLYTAPHPANRLCCATHGREMLSPKRRLSCSMHGLHAWRWPISYGSPPCSICLVHPIAAAKERDPASTPTPALLHCPINAHPQNTALPRNWRQNRQIASGVQRSRMSRDKHYFRLKSALSAKRDAPVLQERILLVMHL